MGSLGPNINTFFYHREIIAEKKSETFKYLHLAHSPAEDDFEVLKMFESCHRIAYAFRNLNAQTIIMHTMKLVLEKWRKVREFNSKQCCCDCNLYSFSFLLTILTLALNLVRKLVHTRAFNQN